MANFFGISVSPEIAAAVVKIDANKAAIDAVKADTGPIRNDVTAIHDTNLPAVKADTGPIRNDVTAIHDTILPSLLLDIGAIRNDMTDIHDTELPAIKIQTTGILNRANQIRAKTNLIPVNQRGTCTAGRVLTASATFVDVINVTGHGKIYTIIMGCVNGADTVEISVQIDAITKTLTHTGDTYQQLIGLFPDSALSEPRTLYKLQLDLTNSIMLINLEFSNTLIIKVRRSAGSTDNVRAAVIYSLNPS